MVDAATCNTPNWTDLSTPDVEVSQRFYTQLFGWRIRSESTGMGDYHVASVGDLEVGGMMAQPPEAAGMPAMWTVFVTVADIEVTAERIVVEGGSILQPPFDIPGGARVAVAADPTGAMFALITGGPVPVGRWMATEPGAVCWVEVLTREPVVAERFYGAVFGWSAAAEDGYTTLSLDGEPVAGLLPMPPEVPAEAPAFWAVYFAVSDAAETERRAVELGGAVVVPTRAAGPGHFAVLADPTGATFDVMDTRSAGA